MNDPAIIDLRIPHGDTLTQTFRLLEAGTPVDLTGAAVAAELRHPRTEEIIPLQVIVGPDPGEFTLYWGDTTPAHGHYRWDAEVESGGVVRTWITGRFHVARDVTHSLV